MNQKDRADLEKIVKRNGGDIEAHRINMHIQYDIEHHKMISIALGLMFDITSDAVDGNEIAKCYLYSAIKDYIQRNPEEYNPVFAPVFTEDELARIKGE